MKTLFNSNKKEFFKKLCSAKAIGFDLDFTLVRYKRFLHSRLLFDCFSKYLVEKKNYSKQLLSQTFSPEFCVKGVVLDTKNGNLIKLNQNKQIVQAIHGNTNLNLTQLVETYGPTRELTGFDGSKTEKYWTVSTYFELAAGCLYNRLVSMNDKEDFHNKRKTIDIIRDLKEAISENFFSEFTGSYYPSFRDNTSQYIHDNSESLVELLEYFKKRDKKLFVLSNSLPHYATEILDSLIGKHWKDYFEVVMCKSLKPKFFHPTNSQSFQNYFDPNMTKSKLFKGATTRFGNAKELMEFLKIKKGEDVVFFGDHPISDIRDSKTLCNWTTVQVEEELDPEANEKNERYSHFRNGREKLWGKYLTCGDELSYWGSQISKYSDYQIPSIAHFVKILNQNNNNSLL
ncbi:5'-nucleotidase domain-containing protein [Anaeramoeba flamelloides]|uniref:5'-nucleotidase domain-containing protein n=1 Tax=Anaeramoeba flamelloides TaxID=1746091 RepID=A0AAV7Z459_9EUKA|nr:5'-nucleotidase domain-containing protein [Anaeramoeba flamelloides]